MIPFQIGLVLSGGATAGAYTAGVMDFLIEALDEWEREHKRNPGNVPCWTVQVNNMTSSSAGALCTMLTAVSLGTCHEPLSNDFCFGDAPPSRNILYRSWVSEFGDGMFSTDDLPPVELDSDDVHPVRSIANSRFLRDMASKFCVSVVPRYPVPDWASGVNFFLTVTNMSGIPYSVSMCEALNEDDKKYRMYKHSDCIGFETGKSSDRTKFSLNLYNPRKCADWQRMYDVSAASASVPLFFPNSIVSRPYSHYEKEAGTTPEMKADWALPKPGVFQYNFSAADGGIFTNEPVGMCRTAMEDSTKKKLSSAAEHSWGACILIDCNANTAPKSNGNTTEASSLLETASKMFGAMLNEAAFKDTDFFEAMDTTNFSQFLISPSREGRKEGEYILATSTMSLFGGLLDEKLRHHDFALGRRNCQQFLKDHFTMDIARGCSNGNFPHIEKWAKGDEKTPIIPLFGSAAEECPLPHWPRFTAEQKLEISERFKEKLYKRLYAMFTTYARNLGLLSITSPWKVLQRSRTNFVRFVAKFVARIAYSWVDKSVQDTLKQF